MYARLNVERTPTRETRGSRFLNNAHVLYRKCLFIVRNKYSARTYRIEWKLHALPPSPFIMRSCNNYCYVLFPVLPLNNYNVEQIFRTVSLTTGGYGSTLGWYLHIPSRHHSDPVSSAELYIKGPGHSWKRIILGLDLFDKTSVADELIPYAEPPAGVWCCHVYQDQGLLLHDVYMLYNVLHVQG